MDPELCASIHRRCYAVGFRILKNKEDAEDNATIAFLALYRAYQPGGLAELNARNVLGPIVWTTARNCALNFVRARERYVRMQTEMGDSSTERAWTDPSHEAEVADLEESLVRTIHSLPHGYRQVLLMHRAGLELTDIASALGLNPNAAKVRLSRARRMMEERAESLMAGCA